MSSPEPSEPPEEAHIAAEGESVDETFQTTCNADARDEDAERLRGALDKFFNDFHQHIFDPVLLRLAALAIREDLSHVHKD